MQFARPHVSDLNWLTEYQTHARLTRNVIEWEKPLHFAWKANVRESGEAVRGGGTTSSRFLSLQLALATPFGDVPLARYVSRRACSQDVTVFIAVRDGCINIMMAHSIPSVLYPYPQTLFSSVNISFGSRHLKKLIKLWSVAYRVNSNHFCKICLQFLEETAPFLGRKKNLLPKLKSVSVLFQMLKMLGRNFV